MNKEKFKSKFDTIFAGTLLGLLIPCISVYIFYTITPTEKSFRNFIEYSFLLQIFTRVLSLCAIPNLAAFYIFMKINYLKASRGIILATFIITFGMLILKGFIE